MTEKQYIHTLNTISRETGFLATGDDAAVIPPCNVMSTDQFIEGTHFLWSHMSAEKLGFKSIVQALSDLAAMGAEPHAVLTSLAWNTSHSDRIAPYLEGIRQACLHYGVPLVGGDITKSPNTFYSDVTVCGWSDSPLKKSGAQPDDLLALTGTLGDARAGLEQITATTYDTDLRTRYQTPVAHTRTILKLCSATTVHAATDISDSLSKSVFAMADASRVGMWIDSSLVPTSHALREYVQKAQKNLDDYKWNSGEDYQLLLALPHSTPSSIIHDHGLAVIGRATSERGVRVKFGDKVEPLTEVGWDPFAL